MIARVRIAAALAATVALAACGGGGKSQVNQLMPTPAVGTTTQTQLRIVGVGDSLTAGVQSGALTGLPIPGGANAGPAGTTVTMPATQTAGYYALVFTQANPGVNVGDPTVSPLPLVKPPGLGSVLVPTTSGFPAPAANFCDANESPANQFGTALSLRLNPAATPLDVAIPGQTVHEALYMNGAVGDCAIALNPSAFPASIVALNALVNGESQHFWPILGTFGQGVTQVSAAAALHGQLALVWLGSNDLLKVAFAGGQAPVVSPASIGTDMTAIIHALQASGAKVVVANLVDVLTAATFFPVTGTAVRPSYSGQLSLAIQKQGIPKALADGIAAQYANAEIAQTGIDANGYFTVNAYLNTLAAIAAKQPPPTLPASNVIPGTMAAQVQALNDGYNAAIASAVSSTGATLVDVNGFYKQVNAAGGYPINPPKCCSPIYGGGFTSLDGIHPSATGYALTAKLFIDTINAKLGLGIAPIDPKIPAIYAADVYAPH